MLREIPSARLFEEVLKLFLSGYAADTFEMLVDLQLFDPLFPASAEALEYNPTYTHTLISEALINTDLRIKQNKPVTRRSCLPPCCGRPCPNAYCACRTVACRRSRPCRKPLTS